MNVNTNQIHPDILEWATRHGSHRLQKGLAAGYSMNPLVYVEWACAHYPYSVLDLDEEMRCAPAECPTEASLSMAERLRAQPHVSSVSIVIAAPYPAYYDSNAKACYVNKETECIVICDDRVPYYLVIPALLASVCRPFLDVADKT